MLVGVSTSSYQIEENPVDTDWYYWERKGKLPKKGKANNSYSQFYKDIELLRDLGVNAYRFSIEFARIMPYRNKINREALNHYKTLISILERENITPVVTLWHYTLPNWLAEIGGVESERAVNYFMDYTKALVYNEVLEGVKYVLTVNEPGAYTLFSYALGGYPPMKKSIKSYWKAVNNIIEIHNVMYDFLKEQGFKVSYAQNMEHYGSLIFIDKPIASFLAYLLNYQFLDRMKKDFLAINYYGAVYPLEIIGRKGVNGERLVSPKESPKGFEIVLNALHSRYNLPIIVSENGIATENEKKRIKYIDEHIDVVKKLAMRDEISGYFYWTLADNYEWRYGYTKKFGLYTIDRKPKESVEFFKKKIEELKKLPNWI